MIEVSCCIRNNLSVRLSNPDKNFKARLCLSKYFVSKTFENSIKLEIKRIKNRYSSIYIGLSGGINSEFIFLKFIEYKIKFKVVIVETTGNQQEIQYAINLCKKFNIIPELIRLSDIDYLRIYNEEVLQKLHGYGLYAIHSLIACKYAKDRNSVLITGTNMFSYDIGKQKIVPTLFEWDFYNECLIGRNYSYNFLIRSVEMISSSLHEINNTPTCLFDLYKMEPRQIFPYNFSQGFYKLVEDLNSRVSRNAEYSYVLAESKEELLMEVDRNIKETYNSKGRQNV